MCSICRGDYWYTCKFLLKDSRKLNIGNIPINREQLELLERKLWQQLFWHPGECLISGPQFEAKANYGTLHRWHPHVMAWRMEHNDSSMLGGKKRSCPFKTRPVFPKIHTIRKLYLCNVPLVYCILCNIMLYWTLWERDRLIFSLDKMRPPYVCCIGKYHCE